ncbi:MAG: hypothetical protein R3B72_08550 [Polyangiaceae bacterium]
MKIDHARFAALAAAIATTTVVAGCPAPDTDQQVGEANEGVCIANPGEGSQSAELYSFVEGTCFDLARFAPAPQVEGLPGIAGINPDYEGGSIDFDDYVYEHCRMYSSQLRPAIAKRVESCLLAADAERERNEVGDPIGRFSWEAMYGCGADTLGSICTDEDTIDNRSDSRCDRVAGALESRGQGEGAFGYCQQVMTGLRGSARAQIEHCVIHERFDIYTCVEGLVDDAALAEDEEPRDECVVAYDFDVPQASCAPVLERLTADEAWAQEFVAAKCQSYLTRFTGPAADVAIACLMDPERSVTDAIYACGARGLRAVCRNEEVHDACAEMVDTIDAAADAAGKGETPNAGGRLTKQCRALLPGLGAEAQVAMKGCVAQQAPSFAEFEMATYTFYSCVEGL